MLGHFIKSHFVAGHFIEIYFIDMDRADFSNTGNFIDREEFTDKKIQRLNRVFG